MEPEVVIKRDGEAVPFERQRIVTAIDRAMQSVGREQEGMADELTQVTLEHINRLSDDTKLGIEDIQDAVIYVLQESGEYEVALAYSRYRDARERQRRQRRVVSGEERGINLMILGRDGRRRVWERTILINYLESSLELSGKAARDVALLAESFLAECDVTELSSVLMMSMVETALVRCGFASVAERRVPLRIDRDHLLELIEQSADGRQAAERTAGLAFHQLALVDDFPAEVLRLYSQGRLWVDGLDDPCRGSEFTVALDGSSNPWHVIANGFAQAVAAGRHWRRVKLVIPPMILGHLERGAEGLIEPLEALADVANCYLYCDGRTPLLDEWPFETKNIGIATYADDFLLLRRLQELALDHLSGPHLMQGGYRRRVAVKLAINAQGLEDHYSQMDALAMAVVAAARVRQRQLGDNPRLAGADIRYAIFGLSPDSPSNEYLERQVVQEGLRCGIALSRTANLPEDACAHLGRLFE